MLIRFGFECVSYTTYGIFSIYFQYDMETFRQPPFLCGAKDKIFCQYYTPKALIGRSAYIVLCRHCSYNFRDPRHPYIICVGKTFRNYDHYLWLSFTYFLLFSNAFFFFEKMCYMFQIFMEVQLPSDKWDIKNNFFLLMKSL